MLISCLNGQHLSSTYIVVPQNQEIKIHPLQKPIQMLNIGNFHQLQYFKTSLNINCPNQYIQINMIHLDEVFNCTITILFGFTDYINFAIYNIHSSDVKNLKRREKMILFIIWSFAIKFRPMTSVNWFSTRYCCLFSESNLLEMENLTHNSFPFLLEATLLGCALMQIGESLKNKNYQ